ncbi:hypothetical protein BJX63DRAFT_16332 [Aspergillus granulosus]|uniref:Uncharacterized protein n=1 Tax=Aspergillus granulosus TaxID=176169 RepID=A0ABR4H0K7_9EURO
MDGPPSRTGVNPTRCPPRFDSSKMQSSCCGSRTDAGETGQPSRKDGKMVNQEYRRISPSIQIPVRPLQCRVISSSVDCQPNARARMLNLVGLSFRPWHPYWSWHPKNALAAPSDSEAQIALKDLSLGRELNFSSAGRGISAYRNIWPIVSKVRYHHQKSRRQIARLYTCIQSC